MKNLADALVYAVTYINCVPDPLEERSDSDVDALESIASNLSAATEEEKEALAAAAKRAFEQEKRTSAREDFLQVYGTWMECMFGEEWVGNDRA